MEKIIIGTRGSKLALWQAHHLQDQLANIGYQSELKIIKTKGDVVQNLSFDKIEGKGFFTKEIEDALLAHEIDIAVHSMKDLPTQHPNGLVIAGVSYREKPNDILIIKKDSTDKSRILSIKANPVIGTSSARRKAQIKSLIIDAEIKDIRGNVPTRIDKLRNGDLDAIILAAAGVHRLALDLSDLEVVYLHHEEFVPAPAQGVVGYQCHEENIRVRKIIKNIHHKEVVQCTNVERRELKKFDGGCHLPLGVHCFKDITGNYHCVAAYASDANGQVVKVKVSQNTTYGLAQKVYLLLQEKSNQ